MRQVAAEQDQVAGSVGCNRVTDETRAGAAFDPRQLELRVVVPLKGKHGGLPREGEERLLGRTGWAGFTTCLHGGSFKTAKVTKSKIIPELAERVEAETGGNATLHFKHHPHEPR